MKPGAEPWNQTKWRGGVIQPIRKHGLRHLLVSVNFLALGLFAYLDPLDREPPCWLTIIITLQFLTLGILTMPFALLRILRAWRFRGSVFCLETLPGVIGGKLRGQLVLPAIYGLYAAKSLNIELMNEKETRSEKPSPIDQILTRPCRIFARTLRIDTRQLSFQEGRCSIPVEFVIPYETKDETDNYREGKRSLVCYRWRVKVHGDIPGINLDLTFEVPVYRTERSDPAVTEPEPSEAESARRLDQQSQRRRVQVSHRKGRPSYIAGAWPGRRRVLLVGILLVVFLASGVFLACLGFGRIGEGDSKNTVDLIFDNIFVGVFLLMSLVFLGLGLLMLIHFVIRFCRRETWIAGGILHQKLTLLGLSHVRKVPCARIERVDHASTGQVNDNPFFAVYVHRRVDKDKRIKTRGGSRKIMVADEIDTQEEAQWLASELNGQIAGSDSQTEERTDA